MNLIAASDDHFAWLLGETNQIARSSLRLPPGGIDDEAVMRVLRDLALSVRAHVKDSAWLIVSDNDVVGLISYMGVPGADGAVEIGYGIAPDHRGRGHATGALKALIKLARADGGVSAMTAGTSTANAASQSVLRRCGFVATHTQIDEADGPMIYWKISVHPPN